MPDIAPQRIPLIEPLENRDATTLTDAKAVNAILEQSTRGTLRVVKRPGLRMAFQGAVGIGQGVDNYLGVLYSISGDVLNSFGNSSTFKAIEATASAGFSARTEAMGVGFLGKLWIMGGFSTITGAATNDIYNSIDGVTWNQVTTSASWSARGAAQLVVFNGTLYLLGGSADLTTGTNFGEVWSSPDGATWTLTNAHAFPGRHNFGVCTSSSLIYVMGGAGPQATVNGQTTNTFYSDVYSSPDGVSWTKLISTAPWVARSKFACYYLNNTIFVTGGQLNDPFNLATSDSWSSPDGGAWTRTSANPFAVAASALWPVAAFQSYGQEFPIPSLVTVTGGTGGTGATAAAFTDFDDDSDDDVFAGCYTQLWFTNVGSGYTAPPSLALGTNVGFNAFAYALLSGTANGGSKQMDIALLGSTAYLLEYNASGTAVEKLWSTTDGLTFTNTNTNFAAGWPVRTGGAFFSFGNLWFIGGTTGGTTTNNDVWFIAIAGGTNALNPNVANGFYHFTQTSTSLTTPLLVFKSLKDLYSYNASLGTLTKLSNVANYPSTTVPGMVYLDTWFFVMDPQGRIWNSAQNDPGTWTALGFTQMQNEPNGGVAIAKYLNFVVGFGVWTTEFFYDNANPAPGSPLQPQTTLPIQVGCAAGESVIEMQNSVVWVGQTRREGQSVYMFNGYTPQKISTAFVDRIIQSDPLTNISAFSVDAFGHSLYILTLRTSNLTLAYSFESQLWTMWSTSTQNGTETVVQLASDAYGTVTANNPNHGYLDGDPVNIAGASINDYNGIFNITYVDANTYTYQIATAPAANPGSATSSGFSENCFRHVASAQIMDTDYLQDPTNGLVYSLDENDYTDNGGPIDMRVVTDRWDGGTTMWKSLRRITLVSDIELFNVMINYTDDDYQTYSTSRFMATSIGQRATITPGGRFRRRAFQIRHTQPAPFRAEALELELNPGSF